MSWKDFYLFLTWKSENVWFGTMDSVGVVIKHYLHLFIDSWVAHCIVVWYFIIS